MTLADPHAATPVLVAGAPLAEAHVAVVLVHGRGASAEDILGFSAALARPGVAFLAPQAAEHTWYPQRFLAPLAANEPWLTSALAKLDERARRDRRRRALPTNGSSGSASRREPVWRASSWRAIPAGGAASSPPSAGASARRARTSTPAGDLARTPVYLGCGDTDPAHSLAAGGRERGGLRPPERRSHPAALSGFSAFRASGGGLLRAPPAELALTTS